MEIDAVAKRVIVNGLDDWVHLFEVSGFAERVIGHGDKNEKRRRAIAAIRQLLDLDLVTIGGVLNNEGFIPSELPAEQVVAQVDKEWETSENRHVIRDSPIWFRNTEKGDELARTFAEQIYAEDDDEDE